MPTNTFNVHETAHDVINWPSERETRKPVQKTNSTKQSKCARKQCATSSFIISVSNVMVFWGVTS